MRSQSQTKQKVTTLSQATNKILWKEIIIRSGKCLPKTQFDKTKDCDLLKLHPLVAFKDTFISPHSANISTTGVAYLQCSGALEGATGWHVS